MHPKPPTIKTIHGKNGIDMDLPPDTHQRMLEYQNGNDRLASNMPFDRANPTDRRPAPGTDDQSVDPLLAAAAAEERAEAGEEAAEAAELRRIQQEEIARRQKRTVSTGDPNLDGSASRISPLVADALNEQQPPAGMPPRPSAE